MIDGYTLLGARSRGAMGIVHAATEIATGRGQQLRGPPRVRGSVNL